MSMLVDGKAIAADIYREVANRVSHLDVAPHLTVFTCAPNFETKKYLALKLRKAKAVGIGVNVIEFPDTITTEEVITSVTSACMQTDGVVVQLPFPEHVDTSTVLSAIPAQYDVDAISYVGNSNVLPPVVGAINAIAKRHNIVFRNKNVVIVGYGRLVGQPAEVWAKEQGAQVTVITKETQDADKIIAAAEVLILGVGQAGAITAEMIAQDVVIFDAGTSEDSGELRGDADPACAEKAALMTPVPGGIGPITVALLFKNLLCLLER